MKLDKHLHEQQQDFATAIRINKNHQTTDEENDANWWCTFAVNSNRN